jgi:DNA-binding beta-propeller fold protein YncE
LSSLCLAGCAPQAISNSTPLDSKLFERSEIVGTRGTGLGQLNKPRSLAVDRDDNLYVVDMTGRVQKFSSNGQYLAFWQMPETTKGKAKGMGRDRDGNIIVVEPHYSRVNHFGTNCALIAQWGVHGTNAGQLGLPRAVAVNSHGEVLVSEYAESERVQKFALTKPAPGAMASEAKLLVVWGKPGTAKGDFNRAEGIAVDRQDRVYVADSCNHRIQVFDADGKFLRAYGRAGSGVGELSYPYDICVDADGRQYVCEFGNSRIQVFDANDQPIEIIGGAGGAPGKFANPWAIALDSHGNLYVADAMNHRVQKLIRRKAHAARSPSSPRVDPGLAFHSPPPDPLPKEREQPDVPAGAPKAIVPATALNLILPLPQGEGWGEGNEGAALLALAINALPPFRIPHSALRTR